MARVRSFPRKATGAPHTTTTWPSTDFLSALGKRQRGSSQRASVTWGEDHADLALSHGGRESPGHHGLSSKDRQGGDTAGIRSVWEPSHRRGQGRTW